MRSREKELENFLFKRFLTATGISITTLVTLIGLVELMMKS